MKIRTKLSAVNMTLILLTAVLITFLTIDSISCKSKNDIIKSEEEMVAMLKSRIRDTISMAYELIETNYKNSQDEKYLKNTYGKQLEDIVEYLQLASPEIKDLKGFAKKIHRIHLEQKKILWLLDIKNRRYLEFGRDIKNAEWLPVNKDLIKSLTGNKSNFLFKPNAPIPVLSCFKVLKNKLIIGAGISAETLQDDAREKSKATLRNLIYNRGMGYIFINNMQCYSVMHPFKPEIEGTDFSNITDARGKKHVVEMAEICREKGEGFLKYYWEKHLKGKTHVKVAPKLSFVKLFKPWGWILGTGVYIDNIDKIIAEKKRSAQAQIKALIKKICVATLVTLLLMAIISTVFASTLSTPLVKMLESMKKVNLNKLDSSKIQLSGAKEIKDLGHIFNSMKDSLRDSLEKIRKTTSEKERIESELNIAREIQMNIIPKLFPAFPNRDEFETCAMLEPAKTIGSDLYDIFFIDDDNLCFLVGDVSGKGVPASLFMIVTRTLLRAKATKGTSAREIISRVNASLCIENEMSMFATVFFAILNLKTGRVNYCNAGHNPPYLIKQQKKLEKISERHGVPLGVIDFFSFSDDTIYMKPGDMLILFNDGIIEATNKKGERFGEQALEKIISSNMLLSPNDCVKMIADDVKNFTEGREQPDDVALLALSYRGSNTKNS